METPRRHLFTIGYAPHTPDTFLALLRLHGVDVVADVRSVPFSARKPEFNRDQLQRLLATQGISYVFLGDQLGARCLDPAAVVDGRVDYERVAELPNFRNGLDRLRQGMDRYSVTLMCAEQDPLGCHRTILVCRHLRQDTDIQHILADGSLEPHGQLETRLIKLFQLDQLTLPGLKAKKASPLLEAYRRQSLNIAHRLDPAEPGEQPLGAARNALGGPE
ncbi:MAG: DUF488 family protein [Desulfovibrionaceae bacterium]